MKKLFALAFAALSALSLLAGCSNDDEPFTAKNYETDAAEIQSVEIDVRDRQIEISVSKDDQIHIDYFENSKESYEISISKDHVLKMTAKSDKEWKDYIGGKTAEENRKISVQLPDEILDSLNISTTNEDILLSEMTVTDSISLSANGGNITFEPVNPGKSLSLTAKNGNIEGTVIGSYEDYHIECKIKKGESNLPSEKKGGSKKLSVSANNGDVKVEFDNQ